MHPAGGMSFVLKKKYSGKEQEGTCATTEKNPREKIGNHYNSSSLVTHRIICIFK